MSLSKKHYIKIAEIISTSTTKYNLVGNLAAYFAEDNPEFKKSLFFKACERKEAEKIVAASGSAPSKGVANV